MNEKGDGHCEKATKVKKRNVRDDFTVDNHPKTTGRKYFIVAVWIGNIRNRTKQKKEVT